MGISIAPSLENDSYKNFQGFLFIIACFGKKEKKKLRGTGDFFSPRRSRKTAAASADQ